MLSLLNGFLPLGAILGSFIVPLVMPLTNKKYRFSYLQANPLYFAAIQYHSIRDIHPSRYRSNSGEQIHLRNFERVLYDSSCQLHQGSLSSLSQESIWSNLFLCTCSRYAFMLYGGIILRLSQRYRHLLRISLLCSLSGYPHLFLRTK